MTAVREAPLGAAAVTGGAWVFPGQGAQHKGMGASLFERHAGLVDEAEDILGFSVRELCLTDPERRLGLTQYLQPALYVVNALSWLEARSQGRPPPTWPGTASASTTRCSPPGATTSPPGSGWSPGEVS